MSLRHLIVSALLLSLPACGEYGPSEPTSSESRLETATFALEVPGDHLTIQAAVDAAPADEIINIAAGTYHEDLVLTKNVWLSGVGAGEVVIFGTIAASNGAGVIVSGVTLDGNLSPTNSTGLSVSGAASIDLTDAILRNFGDGVVIDGGGDSIISRVRIENVSNHGVVLDSVGTVRVDSTTVEFAGSDAFVVEGTTPTDVVIVNCLAFGSGFGTAGNGVTVAVTDNVAITNTIIVSNAGGLDCDSAGCLADHNIVWGNFVNYRG
ncbi:MAG: hypothetical protein ACI9MR_002116, partial [Myxococcota bacterium]